MDNNTDKKKFLAFAALDPFIEDNIISPVEKEIKGQHFVEYGERNKYPNYIYDLYANSTSLSTLVNACTDYIVGDNVVSNNPFLTDAEASELVRKMGFNILLTGGVYINVLRNRLKQVCKVIPLDFRKVRANADKTFFYYSDDFAKKSYGRGKYISYPAFDPDSKDVNASIYYYSNSPYTVYATPVYASATKSCEIEKKISEYHLNNLENNFSANYMISFNNGIPSDEVRNEIEETINQKHNGVENSGRPLISFSPDREHAPQVLLIDSKDWGEKYKSLRDDSREDIFACFRCTPNLLGIPTQTTGFNSQEYAGAFKVFQRSFIQPRQKTICSILDDIFGIKDSIKIEPYSIDFEEDGETVEEITTSKTKEQ